MDNGPYLSSCVSYNLSSPLLLSMVNLPFFSHLSRHVPTLSTCNRSAILQQFCWYIWMSIQNFHSWWLILSLTTRTAQQLTNSPSSSLLSSILHSLLLFFRTSNCGERGEKTLEPKETWSEFSVACISSLWACFYKLCNREQKLPT